MTSFAESPWSGKVAVVTGAGSGIGRALVHRLVDEGMSVLAADIDDDGLAATAAGTSGDVRTQHCDVADAADVEALAAVTSAELGSTPHLLCNNAGVFQGGISWERSLEDWRWCLDVNLWGQIHAIRSFVPAMIATGEPAHIVNTASVAAFVASPLAGPYTVSKTAAFSVTETLAHDLATTGAPIGVSVVCPSSIDTGIARTDRLRPDRPPSESEDAGFVRDALAATTAEGMAPSEAADLIVAGIRAGDFLIATRPSYRDQLQNRFDALATRNLPDVPIID